MIDTHCHVDLYENPLQVLNECEKAGIITIGMTNLPSHFEMGYPHVLPYRRIRLALGMHPLYAEKHAKEFNIFKRNLAKTSYIGEVGLDFSKEGIATKELQLNSFQKILLELKGRNKILSLHSRKAEKEVLRLLIENSIKNAIFHWYSGPVSLIEDIIKAGYFFSINPAMIRSKSGQEIIGRIPIGYILTESDGPFVEVNARPAKPVDTVLVCQYLSKIWNKTLKESETIVLVNFQRLLEEIRISN